MGGIGDITRENLVSVEELYRAAQNLSLQAEETTPLGTISSLSDGGSAPGRLAAAWGPGMTAPFLEKIRELVSRRSRLHFGGHNDGLFRQRLASRLAELGLADYRAYWEHLRQSPGEELLLFDLLTTNESFFFRNPEQFRHLQEVVLPELETSRGREVMRSLGNAQKGNPKSIMKLRILCAGCARGEEPYSVAITVLETLRYPKAWDIEILAGDLSESCLEAARVGFYETSRLKGIEPRLVQKYLTPTVGGAVVGDALRQLVRIVPLNLNDLMSGGLPFCADGARGGFDIIFCRNVMIYFSTSCQQLLVETLSRLLAPGGHLLTGDAEPLHLFTHDLVAVPDAGCLIYKKMEKLHDASAI